MIEGEKIDIYGFPIEREWHNKAVKLDAMWGKIFKGTIIFFVTTLVLSSVFLLCSCGTSKHSTELERQKLTELALSNSLFRRDTAARTEIRLSDEMLNAQIVITELSKPDSSGKQYPTKVTEINLNRQKNEQTTRAEQSGTEATRVKKEDIRAHETEKLKEDVRKDTRAVPTWVWWVLIIGGVVASLLSWIAKKRK